MNELRDIPGFEGRYSASADGRIWSHGRGQWLKPWLSGERCNQYEQVQLGERRVKVHRLVALAWLPNPHNRPQVNHLDGDKLHNAAANLEWCTASENTAHAVRTGLLKPKPPHKPFAKGERITSKLLPDEVAIIKARLARGDPQKAIAADYKVTPPNISAIHRGLIWRDVAPAVMP